MGRAHGATPVLSPSQALTASGRGRAGEGRLWEGTAKGGALLPHPLLGIAGGPLLQSRARAGCHRASAPTVLWECHLLPPHIRGHPPHPTLGPAIAKLGLPPALGTPCPSVGFDPQPSLALGVSGSRTRPPGRGWGVRGVGSGPGIVPTPSHSPPVPHPALLKCTSRAPELFTCAEAV